MTIATTASSVTHGGNGSTTVWTFPFVGVSAGDLQVTYTTAAGIPTVLSPSLYTVVINTVSSGQLWGVGGSVTYPLLGSPISAGNDLTITRIVPFLQTISIANQGNFYPQAVEQGLDLLELQIQQIDAEAEYAIQTPLSDLTPPNTLPSASLRANGYLAFDSVGQPIVLFNSIIPVSPVTSRPRIVTVTTPQTIGPVVSDSFGGIALYQSGSAVTTIQLPSSGGPYPIFDASRNAGSFPITILPPAGLLILGQSSFTMAFSGMSCTFFNDTNEIEIG